MRNVVALNRQIDAVLQGQFTPAASDPWREASAEKREQALMREQFLQPVLDHVNQGVSQNVAIRNVLQHIESGTYPEQYLLCAKGLARKNKLAPSRSVICDWLKQFQAHGRVGLIDKQKGRVRKDYGWEATAIRLYNIPSKPSYAAVAEKLREEYQFETATDSAVRRYLKSMPSTLNESSPQRLGQKYHRLNRGRYVERDTSVLLVGEVYEGDGHTVDAYCAHPNTGKPYRPELTIWIDIRSHYVVGWYLSPAESAFSTLFALSHALLNHDHVPAWVHIDNGAGFKAKMLNDESTGFYNRMDIHTTFAIPGNSKGKGLVEGWFKPFRDKHDKFFNDGLDYCGHDQAEEINRQLLQQLEKGTRNLKSLGEYRDSVARYVDSYNHRPQKKALDGKTPAELWQTLERVSVEMPEQALMRPRETRIASRCCLALHNRRYEHQDLAHYDRRPVHVEYDLHDDSQVWVYDDKNRLICIAPIKQKKAWLPTSRLEEQREKRKQGRLKRIQAKADNVLAEEATRLDHTDTLDILERLDEGLVIDQEFEADTYDSALGIDVLDDDFLLDEEEDDSSSLDGSQY